jgi:hypothetical protein
MPRHRQSLPKFPRILKMMNPVLLQRIDHHEDDNSLTILTAATATQGALLCLLPDGGYY